MTILKPLTSIALISTLVLTACGGASDPNMDHTKAKQAAIVGGVLGAMGGMMAGDNAVDKRQRAVRGAIIGGGLGALIGNELDKQEAALRQSMSNDSVMIQNTGDRLIVTLPQDILFQVDSTTLSPALQSDLRTLAQNLNDYPNSNIQIVGHTDNSGNAGYNQSLSERRAGSVASVLRANGVAAYRIGTYGAGEDQPVASNLTPEGRAQNRRVEIIILPTNNG